MNFDNIRQERINSTKWIVLGLKQHDDNSHEIITFGCADFLIDWDTLVDTFTKEYNDKIDIFAVKLMSNIFTKGSVEMVGKGFIKSLITSDNDKNPVQKTGSCYFFLKDGSLTNTPSNFFTKNIIEETDESEN